MPGAGPPADSLRLRAVDSARSALRASRQSGEIGDAGFHLLEEEMDWIELSATKASPIARRVAAGVVKLGTGQPGSHAAVSCILLH